MSNSIPILPTNNKQTETEFKKVIPFILTTKSIRFLGIKLTKEVQDLYKENYENLKKEIK